MADILLPVAHGVLQIAPFWHTDVSTEGSVNCHNIVFICHPHPLFGGTMHNKVVTTLARFYKNKGYSVILFNFRGVEKSTGSHTGGLGELEDLLWVMRWAFANHPEQQTSFKVVLAGFSFGSYIAYLAANLLKQQPQWALTQTPVVQDSTLLKQKEILTTCLQKVVETTIEPALLSNVIDLAISLNSMTLKQLILVAPPIHHYPMQHLSTHLPVQVIIGDEDEIVPYQQVVDWCKAEHLPLTLLPQCSHFFHRKLSDLTVALESVAL